MLKKALLILLTLAVLAGGLLLWQGERLVLGTMQRIVTHNLSGGAMADFDQGLHLVLCGAGSPMPDPQRSGPCVAVIAGGQIYVFDAGTGGVRNLIARGILPGRIAAVFLTHFHSDHIDGLGELMMLRWVGGRHAAPLPVIGPHGVERVVDGFNAAYRQDVGYRIAHHGADLLPASGAGGVAQGFAPPALGAGLPVLEQDGLTVTAFTVSHPPIEPAVGYRVDYRGRSLVISGDTVKSDNLLHFARGVDLLVHEALAPHLVEVMTAGAEDAADAGMVRITMDIHDYHTTPVEVAELAAEAGVGHLLYYHVVPGLPVRPLEWSFLRGVSAIYPGAVTLGRDGTWLELPAEGREIKRRRR